MAEASQEYLTKMADRQQVMSLVEEEFKTDSCYSRNAYSKMLEIYR